MNKESVYFILQDTNSEERQLINYLVLGFTNVEIAKLMNMPKPNAEYKIKKIYKKFDVLNRRELIPLFLDSTVIKILESPIL